MMGKNAEKFWISIGATVRAYLCTAIFNYFAAHIMRHHFIE